MAKKSLGGLRANTMNATNPPVNVLRGSQVTMAFRIFPLSIYSTEKAVSHPPSTPTLAEPSARVPDDLELLKV